MPIVSDKEIGVFVDAAHKVASHGLVRCGSGNLSWRVDDTRMLITATGAWMGALSPSDVAVCRIADGVVLNDKRPSGESHFHAGVLRERDDAHVVLHFQSPYATALACSARETSCFDVIPELPFYVGPVASVPYLPPGSVELAEAVVAALKTHDLVVLQNHGQVTAGKNFADALQKAVFFELASEILVGVGGQARFIPEEEAANLRARRRHKRPGPV